MNKIKLTNQKKIISGILEVPGDKSISHRSIMFGAIANGQTEITNFLLGQDCLSTIQCFQKLGVSIEQKDQTIYVHGKGMGGLTEPTDILYTGNSGTTTRLLLGILAGQSFYSVLSGDDSVNSRPMSRVTKPLELMGAKILGRADNRKLPISIQGSALHGIEYVLPVASAQVKSALIFAGLQAEGLTVLSGKILSRNHTEQMLQLFGGDIQVTDNQLTIPGNQHLEAGKISVPGDFSSAAFFIALALLLPHSELKLIRVGLNSTRTGLLDVVQAMGGEIEWIETYDESNEPSGDILVRGSSLNGTVIEGDMIPRLIDELPIIALIASQAEGQTIIRDAQELKVKETNRIKTVVGELKKLGAKIDETEDGMIIHGKSTLRGGEVDTHGDHRIGMMLAIASFLCTQEVVLANPECIQVSYPNFFNDLNQLI